MTLLLLETLLLLFSNNICMQGFFRWYLERQNTVVVIWVCKAFWNLQGTFKYVFTFESHNDPMKWVRQRSYHHVYRCGNLVSGLLTTCCAQRSLSSSHVMSQKLCSWLLLLGQLVCFPSSENAVLHFIHISAPGSLHSQHTNFEVVVKKECTLVKKKKKTWFWGMPHHILPYLAMYNVLPWFGSKLSGEKKIFHFNFLIQIVICLYLRPCFILYYKEILAFTF